MLLPLRPRRGATVGVVSPAGRGVERWPKRTRQMTAFLTSLGMRVSVLAIDDGHPIGSVAESRAVARSVMQAFDDDAIDVVLCAMGGNSSIRIVEDLDYDRIRSSRKVFQGSSDVTVLHRAIQARSSLVTLYGPNGLFSLAESQVLDWTREAVTRAWLSSEPHRVVPAPAWTDALYPLGPDDGLADPVRPLVPGHGWRVLVPGRAEGLVDGGCLETLAWHGASVPEHEGSRIVHLDIASSGTRVRGSTVGGPDDAATWMVSLRARGFFAGAVAVTIARPRGYHHAEHAALHDRVLDVLGDLDVPIVADLDVGHTDPMTILPLGMRAVLDSTTQTLDFDGAPTQERA